MPEIYPADSHKHVDLDLIDKCNLQCPTCWRGVGTQKNTSVAMPLEQFRAIAAKVRSEGYINLSLINWTESFLCKTLHEYVTAAREAGLVSWISSNLSLRPKDYLPTILTALQAGTDHLFVSLSGWTQPVYEINHKGGRVDWIKENLAAIREHLRAGDIATNIIIRYLEWPYNAHEIKLWADYAAEAGFTFHAAPGAGGPWSPQPNHAVFNQIVEDRFNAAAATGIPDTVNVPEKVCVLVADRTALDAKGDAYLCCAFPNAEKLRIGSYLDSDPDDLLLLRHNHSFCHGCPGDMRDTTEADKGRFRRAIARAAERAAAAP